MQKKIVSGVENTLGLLVVSMFLPFMYTVKILIFILKSVKNISILINQKINKS